MNKVILCGAIILISVLVVASFLITLNAGNATKNSNGDLEKFRASNIPEECRLPAGNNDIDAWKEHLGHHQETKFCLYYFPSLLHY